MADGLTERGRMSVVGQLVQPLSDDSACPIVGLVIGQEDEDRVLVAWGDARLGYVPSPAGVACDVDYVVEFIDELRPARAGVR